MTRRMGFLIPGLATLLACAAALLVGVPEEAGAASPGQNGRIAFSSDATGGEGVDNPEGDTEIFTVNPDGTGLAQLTRNATGDGAPDWSADGEKITYVGHDGDDTEIFTVPASGGEPTRLTDNDTPDWSPSFSPDGGKVAYNGLGPISEWDPEAGKSVHIFVVPADGGVPVSVLDSDGEVGYYGPSSPAWSPDGDRIAYWKNVVGGEGYSRLEMLGLDGYRAWSGTSYAGTPYNVFAERYPEWSPDGSRIAYEGWDRDAESDGDPATDDLDLYAVGAGGGTPDKLTDASLRGESSLTWSPDGRRVAFSAYEASDPYADYALYTVPAGGGAATEILAALQMRPIFGFDWGPAPRADDAAKPTITAPRPSPGSSTRDRTPTIRATVSDGTTDLAKADVRLYIDGIKRTFSYDPATDRLSRATWRLSYGGHHVRIEAEDAAGNAATRAWSFRVVRDR